MRGYILAHWRGELGLWKSSLVNGVLFYFVLLLASFLAIMAARTIFGDSTRHVAESPVVVYGLVAMFVIGLVWSLVGAFRCGVRNATNKRNRTASRVGGVAVIIGVLAVAFFVARDVMRLLS
jgi:hypothetical protein